jgi:phosphate uptake regulator
LEEKGMSINLEQIEALRQRANVSYEEAKAALELCNGDIVEALIYLERQNKVRTDRKTGMESSFFGSVKQLIKKCHRIKFLIKKEDNIILNLPLTIVILAALFLTPVVVIGLLAALVTNHKIRFQRPDGEDMEINKTFDKMSTAVTTATSQIVNTINENKDNNQFNH